MNVLDAHGQAMSVFDNAVRAIPEGAWEDPTPCTEWNVRDLLNHLVYEQLWVPDLLGGATIAEVGDRYDGDQLGDDPKGRWAQVSAAARSALLEPGAVAREVHLSFGDTSATEYCWQLILDLAVHGWDMATAIKQPHGIPDELANVLLKATEPQIQQWQGSSIFAPPVPVPDDAPPVDRLVALLGRHP